MAYFTLDLHNMPHGRCWFTNDVTYRTVQIANMYIYSTLKLKSRTVDDYVFEETFWSTTFTVDN